MDRLWAPWRMEYIRQIGKNDSGGCIFCEKLKEEKDRDNLVLYRGEKVFVILNAFPYNNGHLMVVPYRHVSAIEELSSEELGEVFSLLTCSINWLKAGFAPHGFNIGINQGRAAGAGIADHIHLHVVPRWQGDVNFMSVIGETKVISESLLASYDRLREVIDGYSSS